MRFLQHQGRARTASNVCPPHTSFRCPSCLLYHKKEHSWPLQWTPPSCEDSLSSDSGRFSASSNVVANTRYPPSALQSWITVCSASSAARSASVAAPPGRTLCQLACLLHRDLCGLQNSKEKQEKMGQRVKKEGTN